MSNGKYLYLGLVLESIKISIEESFHYEVFETWSHGALGRLNKLNSFEMITVDKRATKLELVSDVSNLLDFFPYFWLMIE